jgi:hypothetical protein
MCTHNSNSLVVSPLPVTFPEWGKLNSIYLLSDGRRVDETREAPPYFRKRHETSCAEGFLLARAEARKN